MWPKKQVHLVGRFICLLILIVFAFGSLASAQDSGQAAGEDKPNVQDNSKSPDNSNAMPAVPLGAPWSDSYIRQIGTSGLLAGSREGIGWGSLYISSAGASGIVDKQVAANIPAEATFTFAVLQTTVVYDHKLGNSRIAVQYQPDVSISEGQVVKDFSNQNTSVDLLLYTGPRLNVRFGDGFRYNYTQQSIAYPYLDINPATNETVTNLFIDGPSRWLSDSAYLSITYAASQRSTFAVSPMLTYSESGLGANLLRGMTYGGRVSWNYQTSERQTVGLEYIGQLIREAGPSPSPVTVGENILHTIAGTASRQLNATWAVNGSLGITTAIAANTRQWSYYGGLGLVAQLGRSSVGVRYSRGDTIADGLISSEYADRVDVTFQNQLTPRLHWGVGGGYLRQTQSAGFSGWYSTANTRFLLAPRAGLFASFDYFHKNQSGVGVGVGPNVFIGSRDIFSFGVIWRPGLVPH